MFGKRLAASLGSVVWRACCYTVTGYNIMTTLASLLSKDTRLPLYFQLKAVLERKVEAGEWKHGAPIPSERELCDQFSISRITVRQALAELVHEGKLTRVQGKGTYVSQPRITQQLSMLTGFSQEMRARGQRAGARVLRLGRVPAPAAAIKAFGLGRGEQVIELARLRMADGEALAIETAYLHPQRCTVLLTQDLQDKSLYAVLGVLCGIVPARATQRMQAAECPADAARLLGLRRGAPVLDIQRITFDQRGDAFEVVASIYRGDKYVFHAELLTQR